MFAHSLLGCVFYGAFAAKMLVVRWRELPGVALPLAGGLVFATLVAVWLTSGLWYIDESGGFPISLTCSRTFDRILAPLTWLAATLAVVALLVGPEVIGAKNEEAPAYQPAATATPAG